MFLRFLFISNKILSILTRFSNGKSTYASKKRKNAKSIFQIAFIISFRIALQRVN
jgi:hypothetical protein